jgi:putative tryptophan/tyrosine transport system ATP-binding protein
MIQLQNVSKIFNKGKVNEVTALDDITLRVDNGEFAVIIGVNGSGKTTLLNVIGGAEIPSGGRIKINDTDVTEFPEYKRSKWVARVFQNPNNGTAPDLTILENFRLAALRTGRKVLKIGINDSFKKRVQEKIALLNMGLEDKIHLPMGSLSGGQRQALTLLMSSMDGAEVLLLDEPSAALDPKSSQIVMNLADKLNKELGISVILITHNIKDAHNYGNRLIQIQRGKIIQDYAAAEKEQLQLQDIYEWFE